MPRCLALSTHLTLFESADNELKERSNGVSMPRRGAVPDRVEGSALHEEKRDVFVIGTVATVGAPAPISQYSDVDAILRIRRTLLQEFDAMVDFWLTDEKAAEEYRYLVQ